MRAGQCLEKWQPMGAFFYEPRLFTRQHQNAAELKAVIKNQLEVLSFAMDQSESVTDQLKQAVGLFEMQIKELDKAILEHIKSNDEVAERIKNIGTMKRLGVLSAATALAAANGFNLFRNYKQFVSYAGYDVVEARTGT